MFIKEKMTQYGIPAKYWKVRYITIDAGMKEASFTLNLYLSPDAPTAIEDVCVSDFMGKEDKTLFDEYFGESGLKNFKDAYDACYSYAQKYVEYFKDAERVE